MFLKVESYHDGQFWCARALGEDIFTQGETLDELVENLREAVAVHYGDATPLPQILLLSEIQVGDAAAAADEWGAARAATGIPGVPVSAPARQPRPV